MRCVVPLTALILSSLISPGAVAQSTTAEINAEKDRLVAEKDRIAAQKDLINAQADLERARVTALGLPSFQGTTELKDGAGKLEATILATGALDAATNQIVAAVSKVPGPFLVLAGDEKLDFASHDSVRVEMDAIHALLVDARSQAGGANDFALPGLIAAVSAVAGLLRSEVTVSQLDLGTVLPNRLLAGAVASRLAGAVRPGAIIQAPMVSEDPIDWTRKNTAQAFNALVEEAAVATARRSAIPDKPNAAQKALASRLDRALARYKAFYDLATTADSAGIAPIVSAARLDGISGRSQYKVLRVYVEQGGGTFLNSKNLATTFGADPVRVSGGVIASFEITDPHRGTVEGQGVFACRSTLTTLARVQSGAWRNETGGATGSCD